MRMRLPKPKKVFEKIRKKARRPFPTEEVSGTNGVPKGAAGRKAAGKMVPRKEAREEAPGRQAPRAEVFSQEVRKEAPRNDTSRHETPRMDGLGHDALRKVKPTHGEPTLDDEHYAALLSGDGKALHDILDHGRRASQRPSSANPRRNHMDDVHVENGAEAPTRDVAPPERSDTSPVQDRRPRAGGTLKRAKQSGIMRKVSSVPLRGASFRNASFDGATFDGASFDNACFDGACFNGGSFNNASFDGATFDGARFNGGSFHGASFNGASFKGASFEGASFGQKGTNEVEDGHSITAEDHHIVTPKDRHSPTTEDLDHIYQDRHDESDVLKDSERHLQPEPRVDDTSADAVVISKVPKLDHVQIPNGDMPADDFVSSKELKLNEAPCTLESNDDITIIKKIIPKDSEKKVQLQTRDGDKSADVVVNDKELKHNQALHKIVRHDDNTIIEDHSHLNGSVKDAVVSKEPFEPQVQLEIGSKAGSIIGSKAGTRTTTSSEYVQDDGIPPLQLNYDALKHVATHFMPGSHGACVDITEMERGSFHEIRALIFEDGWSCIGRFTRVQETLAKTESELATLRYVGKHTRIPIPEIYFVNYNSNHVVGAAFVLMERLQGCSLAEIWRDLSMEHKLIAMEQIAHVVGELATLRFDRIGSLTGDGTIGPLINISQAEGESPVGPFGNFIDCVDATLDETRRHGPQKAMDLYPALRQEMRACLAREDLDKVLQPPYRLTHVDLQTRNILVKCENDQEGPKITGVIDWDWAFAGPSYYLYEHIEEVTDLQKSESELPLAKSLRKHFVKTLLQRLPKDSPERDVVKQCFRKKTLELTEFSRQIRWPFTYDDEEFGAVYSHLFVFQGNLHVRDRHPYFAVDMEWKPDTDNEEDDGKDDDVDDRDDEE